MRLPRQFALIGLSLTLAGGALIAHPPQGAAAPQGPGQDAGRGQGSGRGGQETPIEEGQECPPGMTEFRHLQCAAPAAPLPAVPSLLPGWACRRDQDIKL